MVPKVHDSVVTWVLVTHGDGVCAVDGRRTQSKPRWSDVCPKLIDEFPATVCRRENKPPAGIVRMALFVVPTRWRRRRPVDGALGTFPRNFSARCAHLL